MTRTRKMILHIGGPKCGSSALQAALSMTGVMKTNEGRDLAYIALRPHGEDWRLLQGRALRLAAVRSVHGYVSFPNLGRLMDKSGVYAALDRVWASSDRGAIPVMSNEGWVGQADAFAHHVPHWFDPAGDPPQITLQAHARPPLEWLNAAYWQWGVWSGRSFDGWLGKGAMEYRMGRDFTSWAAMGNVRLHLRMGGDVISQFEGDHGVALNRPAAANTSQTPAMVGFMLRNRRFRQTAHDSATEFVFQRWCRIEGAPKLWALKPKDLLAVRAAKRDEVAKLFDLLPEAAQKAVRQTDPRWTSDEPYHDLVRAGRSKLNDPQQLADLYAALGDGVERAAKAARASAPVLAPAPALSAGLDVWDGVVGTALSRLIEIDTAWRQNTWRAIWNNVI